MPHSKAQRFKPQARFELAQMALQSCAFQYARNHKRGLVEEQEKEEEENGDDDDGSGGGGGDDDDNTDGHTNCNGDISDKKYI